MLAVVVIVYLLRAVFLRLYSFVLTSTKLVIRLNVSGNLGEGEQDDVLETMRAAMTENWTNTWSKTGSGTKAHLSKVSGWQKNNQRRSVDGLVAGRRGTAATRGVSKKV